MRKQWPWFLAVVAGQPLPGCCWGFFTDNVADRIFKERYEERQCAGFGKIYSEQELAEEIAKRQNTDTTIKRNVRTDYSTIDAAIDSVLLSELGGDLKGLIFSADPCLLPTLLLAIVLNRSASFAECCQNARFSSLLVCVTFGINFLSPQALC